MTHEVFQQKHVQRGRAIRSVHRKTKRNSSSFFWNLFVLSKHDVCPYSNLATVTGINQKNIRQHIDLNVIVEVMCLTLRLKLFYSLRCIYVHVHMCVVLAMTIGVQLRSDSLCLHGCQVTSCLFAMTTSDL